MAGLMGMTDEETMGLAGGLLSAPGPRGFAAGLAGIQSARDNALKQRLVEAQLGNYQSEIDARKLATVKDQRMQKIIEDAMNGGGGNGGAVPAQMGQLGSGSYGAMPTAPGMDVMPQGMGQQQRGGFLSNMSPDKLGALKMGGIDLTEQWKLAQQGLEMKAGSYYRKNGVDSYMADPTKGIGLSNGTINMMPGSENLARLAGQTSLAQEMPKALLKSAGSMNLRRNSDNTDTPVSELSENPMLQSLIGSMGFGGGTGGSRGGPAPQSAPINQPQASPTRFGIQAPNGVSQHHLDATIQTESGGNPNALSPKGAGGVMQVMPGTNTSPGFGVAPAINASEGERSRVGAEYLGKMQERYQNPTLASIAYNWGPGNTDKWLASGGDFNKLPKETRDYVSAVTTRAAVGERGQPSPAQPPAGAPRYGMTNNQQANAKFGEKLATDQAEMLTQSHKSAGAASDSLLSINEARKSIAGGSFMGSGAETKLAIAKFINANVPGVNIDPAKVSNTDYLKSTLGDSLLKEAKTLGTNPSNADAARIDNIVGTIGKDPQAMAKILDFRQEMAQRSITQHNGKVDQAEKNGFKGPFDMRVQIPVVDQPATANAPAKTASLSDITATAKASGRSTAEVTAAMRAKGYKIGDK